MGNSLAMTSLYSSVPRRGLRQIRDMGRLARLHLIERVVIQRIHALRNQPAADVSASRLTPVVPRVISEMPRDSFSARSRYSSSDFGTM